DSVLRVWDAAGKELRSVKWEAEYEGKKYPVGGLESVAVAPDGRTVVACHPGGGIRVWDLATLRDLRTWFAPTRGSLWFVPGGRTRLVGGDGIGAGDGHTVHFFDATTGKPVRRFDGHDAALNAIAVTPDGKTIVTASEGGDGPLRTWTADG